MFGNSHGTLSGADVRQRVRSPGFFASRHTSDIANIPKDHSLSPHNAIQSSLFLFPYRKTAE